MAYSIRNAHGELMMEVDNDVALEIIQKCDGFFRPYQAHGKEKVTVYEITDGKSLQFQTLWGGRIVKMYLWKKHLLIPGTD